MRLLTPIVAALLATAAPAATVRVAPWRASGVPEGQVTAVTRASEAAMRELSTLTVQPALLPSPLSRRCGAEDQGCWAGLVGRAGTDYTLVLVAEPVDGVTITLAMVDVQAHQVTQRRYAAPSAEAAAQGARAAVEALVPPFLHRGYGGVLVDMPRGTRLKVDGKVVLAQPSRAPVGVASGRHEVDLLLPDGTAVLARADVAEGRTAALDLSARPPGGGQGSNNALKITSAALWTAGTVAVVSSLLLATVVNLRAGNLKPCATGTQQDCPTQAGAEAEQKALAQYTAGANSLLIGGGVLAAGGGLVFTFDLLQGGGQ